MTKSEVEEVRRMIQADYDAKRALDRRMVLMTLLVEAACPHVWGTYNAGECQIGGKVHDVFRCEICGKDIRVPRKTPKKEL